MDLVLAIYGVGVLVSLIFTDASPLARVGLALAWPIGPLAFVLTFSLLLAASLIAFPILGAIVAIGVVVLWLVFLRR